MFLSKESIGVCIATYNGSAFIEDQLKSIINQTMGVDEIIISDGGSIDNTVEKCKKTLKGSSIKYQIFTTKNRLSVTENFEKAIRHANSEYIFISDQDDVWINNKVFDVIRVMKDRKAGCLFSNALLVDKNLNSLNQTLWDSVNYNHSRDEVTSINAGDVAFINELLKHNVETGMCMCIHRELLNYALPFPKNVLHDNWIALIAALSTNTVAYNKELVLYRQHENNVVAGTKNAFTRWKLHGPQYKNKIYYRINEIYELKHRLLLNESINSILNKYNKYLKDRWLYISGEKSIFYLFAMRQQYIEYEILPMQIMIKDFYTRLFQK